MPRKQNWLQARRLTPEKLAQARQALDDIRLGSEVLDAIRKYPLESGHLSKSMLVAAYYQLVESDDWEPDPELLARIRLKPVRTLSGVTTVTVLTKPHPCPGMCIFCPDDVRMPKSYLPDEPGAMRGLEHKFDPFAQVTSRLRALMEVGHPTDKIELLILGGTWSTYPRQYQSWFVACCLDAMNMSEATHPCSDTLPSIGSTELENIQRHNETAVHRNVGMVIETRPDMINAEELDWLRYLGVTKVQMGIQSMDDDLLILNKRGHTVSQARQAVALLRAAGFKIVLHWMPNLLGATPASDRQDFSRLWDGLCPDEIKIYPTQLLENTELYDHWRRGEYNPYSTDPLIELIADIKPTIPRYCRVNRVIRDIPSPHVVEGNKRTSLRQDVQLELTRRGTHCECIRCREVRGQKIKNEALQLVDMIYAADSAEEHFISYVTPDDLLAGFIRLSLPLKDSPKILSTDLDNASIVREVHIYGQSLPVGSGQDGAAQHIGLGTRLLEKAEQISMKNGFSRIAVISAVGTRRYYLERGYRRGERYLVKEL